MQFDESPIFDPFEINYNVTEEGLVDSGYTTIPEDVPLLGKQIGDTLIYYQLNYECDSLTYKCVNTNVSYRFCIIHLTKADTVSIRKLISMYDADIISNFLHQDEINLDGTDLDSASHASWGFHGTFYVQHRFTKQIFKCYVAQAIGGIDKKQEGFELSIRNQFPWNEEEIKRNRWIYEYDEE
jgi:hypothetical protein